MSSHVRTPAKSLTNEVVGGVRAMIRDEGLHIGDLLPSEAAVGKRLGVSRAVVREAFRSMATLKLIDIGSGRRARVAAMGESALAMVIDHAVQTDQITVQQVLDVRRTVEMRTVALAALRRSDAEAERIVELAAIMRRSFDEPEKIMEHDILFHEAIARASRNPVFALMVDSFREVTRETWPIGWAARLSEAARSSNLSCHEAIAEAVAKRDQSAARERMAEHFDDTVTTLLAAGIN